MGTIEVVNAFYIRIRLQVYGDQRVKCDGLNENGFSICVLSLTLMNYLERIRRRGLVGRGVSLLRR